MRSTMLLALALAFPLSACAPKLERNVPADRVYRLTPPTLEVAVALPVDLLVLDPVVAPGLATQRIATLWPGNRLDYYASARWSGPLGAVVQGATVEALSAAGALRHVQAEPGRFGATHLLGLELRRFEADYAGGAPPVARVAIAATVARYDRRLPLAAFTASAEVPAAEDTLGAVTTALDQAFHRALEDLLSRSQQALLDDLARQPPATAAR